MTDQLIPPVISPSARPARGAPGRTGGGRPLSLANSPGVPADAVYGMSRVDASGRVAGQVITSVLNWRPGDRLMLTACAGVVVARRDPAGMVTVPTRCCVAVPAALRHRCGLRPGDRVLRAGQDTLTACTLAVVDQALRAHRPVPAGDGGRP